MHRRSQPLLQAWVLFASICLYVPAAVRGHLFTYQAHPHAAYGAIAAPFQGIPVVPHSKVFAYPAAVPSFVATAAGTPAQQPYQPAPAPPAQSQPAPEKPTQAHPVAQHPVQGHPVQTHPVAVHPVQAHPVQAHPVQVHPVQAHPVQVHPVQAHPVQVHPVQAHPVHLHPVPVHPVQAQQVLIPYGPAGHAVPVKLLFTRFPPVIEGLVNRIQTYFSTYLQPGYFPQDHPAASSPPISSATPASSLQGDAPSTTTTITDVAPVTTTTAPTTTTSTSTTTTQAPPPAPPQAPQPALTATTPEPNFSPSDQDNGFGFPNEHPAPSATPFEDQDGRYSYDPPVRNPFRYPKHNFQRFNRHKDSYYYRR